MTRSLTTQPSKRGILPALRGLTPRKCQMAIRIRLREVLCMLGSIAIAWPLALHAQQATMPSIGYLTGTSREGDLFRAAFHEGLKESGYVEGRNVLLEYRWAGYRYDQLS